MKPNREFKDIVAFLYHDLAAAQAINQALVEDNTLLSEKLEALAAGEALPMAEPVPAFLLVDEEQADQEEQQQQEKQEQQEQQEQQQLGSAVPETPAYAWRFSSAGRLCACHAVVRAA